MEGTGRRTLLSFLPGHIRLYRGQYAGGPAVRPDWILQDPDYQLALNAAGRWFTSDEQEAREYAREAGSGEVLFVDIPIDIAESFAAANNAEARKFVHHTKRGRANDEYFLPRDLAQAAAFLYLV